VTGTAPAPGSTSQFTATAKLSDGTTQTVTSQAAWSSSNTAVATVASTGMVTGVGLGEVDITATDANVSGILHIALVRTAPPTFTLSGTVTDNFSHGILPNIVVQITSGPNSGVTTRTDATGNYAIAGLSPGTFNVSFSAVSYYTVTNTVTFVADTRLDVVLPRNLLIPPDGTYRYVLKLHLVFAHGPTHCGPQMSLPVIPPDLTFDSGLVVTGDQLRYSVEGTNGNAGLTVLELSVERTGSRISGTLRTPNTIDVTLLGNFLPNGVLFNMAVTGTVDNVTGSLTGTADGWYDIEIGLPAYYYCANSEIAFTLTPQS
jgi:hypothetical protein